MLRLTKPQNRTIGNPMSEQATFTLGEAARAVNRSKSTLSKAINGNGMAQQMSQAAPEAAESARVAVQQAAIAKGASEELDKVVARALDVNTPDAWSKAMKIASSPAQAVVRTHQPARHVD